MGHQIRRIYIGSQALAHFLGWNDFQNIGKKHYLGYYARGVADLHDLHPAEGATAQQYYTGSQSAKGTQENYSFVFLQFVYPFEFQTEARGYGDENDHDHGSISVYWKDLIIDLIVCHMDIIPHIV